LHRRHRIIALERAFVIPVAIVSPAAIAPQSAAPQGAAPGGVFAALFAALAQRPAVESAASPKGETSENALALIQAIAPNASPSAESGNGETPIARQAGDPTDRATPAVPMAAPMTATLLAVPVPAPAPPESGEPPRPQHTEPSGIPQPTVRPATPNLASVSAQPATAQEAAATPSLQIAPAKPVARGNATAPTPNGIPSQPLSSETAPPLPLANATETPPQAVTALPSGLSRQAQVKANRLVTPDTSAAAAPPMQQDDASSDVEPLQLHQAARAKTNTPGTDAKPAASDAKPAAFQTAAAGGNSSSFFVASATPDAFMPLPATDAAGQVKTVPLSNLANLPNGAAVTAIGAVIAGEAASGTNRFLIRLDPPELGRIDVRLRFGRDGEVHARLIADRPETVSLLMRDAATLERALNASGMRTADGIDVMLRDSSGGFAHNDGGLGGDAPAEPSYRAPAITADSESDPPPAWTRPELSGRLDLTV
jgi:hypothetical protein